MNLSPGAARELASELVKNISKNELSGTDVLVCPPFISLTTVEQTISGSGIYLGAQDVYFENDGAFTGEISASMLKDSGCKYVIIGHSERRKLLHETNKIVNKKIKKALESGLRVILCIGESFEEREDEIYEGVVEEQITDSLSEISAGQLAEISIAYEPVWAIGTGVNATPKQIVEMHEFVRKVISGIYDKISAENILILYGGSVNQKNAQEILSSKGVDGALVGGASLKAADFESIVKTAAKL